LEKKKICTNGGSFSFRLTKNRGENGQRFRIKKPGYFRVTKLVMGHKLRFVFGLNDRIYWAIGHIKFQTDE